MNLKIIYEDENIIVIDKPAGIAVHPPHPPTNQKNKTDTTLTIVQLVSRHCPDIQAVGEDFLRPGIVHRLDKETSGLMIIAKNNKTFLELKKQFKDREVAKKYIALVMGLLPKNEGVIETPLQKIGAKTRTVPQRVENDKNPVREASTRYKVLKRFSQEEYTLIEVTPKTGRTHQIRVHLASINHPVACDKLYGGKTKKCPPGLNRHFLHASGLKFTLNNALMEFEVELPRDLKKILESLA